LEAFLDFSGVASALGGALGARVLLRPDALELELAMVRLRTFSDFSGVASALTGTLEARVLLRPPVLEQERGREEWGERERRRECERGERERERERECARGERERERGREPE
jgi:hypothetical protein